MWIHSSCFTKNNSTESIARNVIDEHRIIQIYIIPNCTGPFTQIHSSSYTLKGILPSLSMSTSFPPSKNHSSRSWGTWMLKTTGRRQRKILRIVNACLTCSWAGRFRLRPEWQWYLLYRKSAVDIKTKSTGWKRLIGVRLKKGVQMG
jgi:hypothetical protein